LIKAQKLFSTSHGIFVSKSQSSFFILFLTVVAPTGQEQGEKGIFF
jgi:hypothetical protein